jgi:protein disulfide-isomerase
MKIIVLFCFVLHVQAVQSQELKWHTNVKEAIAIGIKSTSLDDIFYG